MKLREDGLQTDIEVQLERKLSRSLKAAETSSLGGAGNRFNPAPHHGLRCAIVRSTLFKLAQRLMSLC
jgi:hypothetical protein